MGLVVGWQDRDRRKDGVGGKSSFFKGSLDFNLIHTDISI